MRSATASIHIAPSALQDALQRVHCGLPFASLVRRKQANDARDPFRLLVVEAR
jgi:hypothetical protein